MGKRYIQTGGNPYKITPAPNVFNPLPPEDLINRQGEPMIWIRAIPNPTKISEMKMGLPGEESWLYRMERTIRIPNETLNPMRYEGQVVKTVYGPISKINSLKVFRAEAYGGELSLKYDKLDQNRIYLSPNTEFKDYYAIACDYEIESFNRYLNVEYIQEIDGNILTPTATEIIVKVTAVWREKSDGTGFEQVPFIWDFTKISLGTVAEAKRRYILDYTTYAPIMVGYRKIDSKDQRLAEKQFDLQVGDLEIVVGAYTHFSKDDILIPVRTLAIEKELLVKDRFGRYPVKYSPLREIVAIYTDSMEFQGWVEDSQYVRLRSETLPEQIICVYKYSPRYNILAETTQSALANRIQPRQYTARINQTRIDLGRIFSESAYRTSIIGSVVGGPGLSAYDIAKDHGFIGSEVDFLASLRGPKGDPGDKTTVTGPAFTYEDGKLVLITYDDGATKTFYYTGDRLDRIDFLQNGITNRKIFNYTGETLVSIDETII